ncbi:MAG: hypothetical protein ACRD3T_06090 [Terriglobia bacterium]
MRRKTWLLLGALFMVSSMGYANPAAPQASDAQGTSNGSPATRQTSQNSTSASAQQPANAASQSEMDALKRQLMEQQKQIEKMQQALDQEKKLLEKVATAQPAKAWVASPSTPPKAKAVTAQTEVPAKAAAPPAGTTENQVASLAPVIPESDAAAQKASDAALPISLGRLAPSSAEDGLNASDQQMNPAVPNAPEAPISLRIGRAEFTPVGFMDATAFFRSTNTGSGIGTSFGSIPYGNTPQTGLTEYRQSIQNSRLGLMIDSTVHGDKVRGYWESDFLGAQPNTAFVTSNSDSFRIRLFWVDVTHGKFEFLAGQSWSMITPNRVGISPMPSDIFYSQDFDTNYQLGLTWSRQLQFRFLYHPSKVVTMGLSVENPNQYVSPAVTLPSNFSASQVDTGAGTSSANLFPDLIGKIAIDGHTGGKLEHIEFVGLMSQFKTYTPNNTTATATGGGASINFNLELAKNFHAILNTFYSDGGGRYIIGLGPDFIVHPDGTPGLEHAESMIGGFEANVTPNSLIYSYYGGAYYFQNYDVIPATSTSPASYVGYGYPGSSNSNNRSLQELSVGLIQTFWKNPHYGALQLMTQYSYLTRAPWFIAVNSPKNAHLGMAYLDVRYVLP